MLSSQVMLSMSQATSAALKDQVASLLEALCRHSIVPYLLVILRCVDY